MKLSKNSMIIIAAVVAIVIAAFAYVNGVVGNAIGYGEKVTEAYSAIKIQEKRRAELLPNMVDAIQAYDKHEYETLIGIVNARRGADGNFSDEDAAEIKAEINKAIDIVVEKYPELKSQQNYIEYMRELPTTENKIAETRQAYNSAVSRYNKYTQTPFNSFILSIGGYEVEEFQKLDFNVSDEAPSNLFNR